MALKNYEDGMTRGSDGLHARSVFALEHDGYGEALSGDQPTGKFVPVDLADVCPVNEEKTIPGQRFDGERQGE